MAEGRLLTRVTSTARAVSPGRSTRDDVGSAPPTASRPGMLEERHPARPRAIAKRGLDLTLAILLLVLLLPLLLIVAILIKLDTPGPILFRQRRLGKDMRPFQVLKFRTMRTNCSPELHVRYIAQLANGDDGRDASRLKKLTEDPRVTAVGRVLRRLSIDEIPQLLNVLTGPMSLVGPRPALDYELEHYQPVHYQRFTVRPGITGLWQVSGRNTLGFKAMLDLDVTYATTATFWTDVGIVTRTPRAAFRHGA